jgi:hydroxymethyl cephem carbamoyltransferase
MLVLGLKPGHDGAVAAIKDRRLLFSLESEKDSGRRYSQLTLQTFLEGADLDACPDLIAVGGWFSDMPSGPGPFNAGYVGALAIDEREGRFYGQSVRFFTSSHVRSHIMGSVGMAPRDEATTRAVLVWEGLVGSFYLLDERFAVTAEIPVLIHVGNRYAALFAIADPTFADDRRQPRNGDAGKLMALAAFGDPGDATDEIRDAVEGLLARPVDPHTPVGPWGPRAVAKGDFRDSPLYNVGVESEAFKAAAAYLTERVFSLFADTAIARVPGGIPLHIGGGCGLNCDWNSAWQELDHFSSVFVPPCANDSGSSIGHALDALHSVTGDPYIEWDVYSGRDFEWDREPDAAQWRSRAFDEREIAHALAEGQVFAWVQGRWEIGPRALGNRSILAEPFNPSTRDRLNAIKQREGYRPIAPCCRVEDLSLVFNEAFEDPYMLYFRTVRSDRFGAVTHVDGSARCQTVTESANPPLHRLLSSFAEQSGFGLLCNTSLNFKGRGFINRMSDLVLYSEARGLDSIVVGDKWYERVRRPETLRAVRRVHA